MRVYLDNCCFNRPFDEQSQLSIRIETEAKLRVQALMREEIVEYAWSDALDYEIAKSPFFNRTLLISPWRETSTVHIDMDYSIIARGAELMQYGIKKLDALHLASAEAAECDWFLTTDKGILKKIENINNMRVANPIDFIMEEQI